jgi:uncharacterized alpha-E superfamily protein
MLSSVAERVYWLGRYLERVENSARLMNVYSAMLFDLPRGSHVDWPGLIDISGCNKEYEKIDGVMEEKPIVKFLLMDASNPVSIFTSLKMARENARTTREIIPAEVWEQVNHLYLETKEALNPRMGRRSRNELLEQIIADCQRISGLFSGSMSHNDAYAFIQVGRKLERADMTTRVVDVGSISLLPGFAKDSEERLLLEPYKNVVWMNVLRSLSAYQAYRQNVQNRVSGKEVVRFLLQDEEFPRSVSYCLSRLSRSLEQLPHGDDVQRAVSRVKRVTGDVKISALLEGGLLDFIDELQISIADIHEELSKTWFSPAT